MLNKSEFLIFLDSPLHFWAYKHGLYTSPKSELAEQFKRQGYDVETCVAEYFRALIPQGVIEQKTFFTKELECRTDFLVYDEGTNSYDLYEVKSSTDVKLDHEYDILFQYIVASQTITIRNLYIVYLNKEYERGAVLDFEQLFKIRDVTDLITTRNDEVERLINDALNIATKDSPDGLLECFKPKNCPCPQLCFPLLPEYSIYSLSNCSEKMTRELRASGILDINDIPDSFNLSHKQRIQLISTKLKSPVIDTQRIAEFISRIQFPLHFLDYESYSWSIPQYNRHRVYENVVFQYSLHIQKTRNSTLDHHEYLAITTDDPIKLIAKDITEKINGSGSILVWNKDFEKRCNRDMARIYPEYREKLYSINERIIDLGDIFSKQMYVDYRFKGSWSIKNILPVLVPDLDYKKMEISNGTLAMTTWESIVYGNLIPQKKNLLIDALLKYCELDTYAMYRILEEVIKRLTI
ncbi:MAG: hypothetical protein UT34_C0001G0146 [candidate division WS6 bacterium GW2011_GWF2_39_15]|uniref:DUF2779 domain-containing protein n=1 Tax=candidate division WS6 bacterium GW2011_GWF2_39_15 TaxID=1619100 RepID=A0A0G0MZY3_9BACT|nr:MAG: hypothetical protein UT34_C0001G0146 [candidate division WS6 bacterium GW2011_GWF2_39_15]